MRINCLHGYFIFDEIRAGELSQFISRFGLDLVRKDNYFTFEALADAPDYSIKANTYLNAIATETYAGKPWEVMRENSLVYNFNTGLLVQIESITSQLILSEAGNYFLSPGLILPGSVTDDGQSVTDYAAWYSFETLKFRYSEVGFGD